MLRLRGALRLKAPANGLGLLFSKSRRAFGLEVGHGASAPLSNLASNPHSKLVSDTYA